MPEGVDVAVPMLRMSDPLIRNHAVQDVLVGDAGSEWFWTAQHPRLQLSWDDVETGWEFDAGFTIAEVVLKQTGPIHVTFLVNDHVAGSAEYKKDGNYRFQAPVPPEWIRGRDRIVVGLDIDPVYIAPGDGAKLGVLLRSIGLRKAAPAK